MVRGVRTGKRGRGMGAGEPHPPPQYHHTGGAPSPSSIFYSNCIGSSNLFQRSAWYKTTTKNKNKKQQLRSNRLISVRKKEEFLGSFFNPNTYIIINILNTPILYYTINCIKIICTT